MLDETPTSQPPVDAPTKRRKKVPGEVPPPETVVKQDDETAGLPNAIDIDARVIKGPVLTKQGWVVPDEAYQAEQRKLEQARKTLGIG